jgi:hypothetical protein
VRQRQDDKRWEMRGGEDEVCPMAPHTPWIGFFYE